MYDVYACCDWLFEVVDCVIDYFVFVHAPGTLHGQRYF
jgi:hypothetical protein